MLSSLLIAILVALPGVMPESFSSKKKHLLITFSSLCLAAAITLNHLPLYCRIYVVLAYLCIFMTYLVVILRKTLKT